MKTPAADELAGQTRHVAGWDGTDRQGRSVGPGICFARLDAEGAVLTQKLMLLR